MTNVASQLSDSMLLNNSIVMGFMELGHVISTPRTQLLALSIFISFFDYRVIDTGSIWELKSLHQTSKII